MVSVSSPAEAGIAASDSTAGGDKSPAATSWWSATTRPCSARSTSWWPRWTSGPLQVLDRGHDPQRQARRHATSSASISSCSAEPHEVRLGHAADQR